MASNTKPKTPATATYTVLRAIFMHGKRIEVGEPVEMTHLQYAEAHNAGKVGPYVPAPEAAKAPKTKAEPTPNTPKETDK